MDVQVLHVSQMFETFLFIAVTILFITQAVSLYNQLWNHIASQRTLNQMQENEWIAQIPLEKQEKTKDIIQKNAIDSLRRQMTQIENKNVQNEPEPAKKEDASVNQLFSQVSPNQKTFMTFYLQYNYFMSEHGAIIFSLFTVGMLTSSTYVFSVACFFCFLFLSIITDFLHLQDKMKEGYKSGIVIGRIVKLFASLIIFALFISYWASEQYVL